MREDGVRANLSVPGLRNRAVVMLNGQFVGRLAHDTVKKRPVVTSLLLSYKAGTQLQLPLSQIPTPRSVAGGNRP